MAFVTTTYAVSAVAMVARVGLARRRRLAMIANHRRRARRACGRGLATLANHRGCARRARRRRLADDAALADHRLGPIDRRRAVIAHDHLRRAIARAVAND